ncbi:MAG: crotonase/enoyl-CoA hydratase family protein [Actinomycetota bacterium]
MDTDTPISVERRGPVAIVWLDRPDHRNAFAPVFWTSFPAAIEELGDDPEVRAIVVAAKGTAFTVGIDLKTFGPTMVTGSLDPAASAPSSPVAQRAETRRLIKKMQHTFSSLAECPKPVIAAIHGYCIGAGVDLVTACDIRYASVDAVFSIRETRLAMVADVGTLQRLPRIIDPGSVAELAYTGRDFDAGEAASLGLVTQLHPDAGAAVAAAIETAELIAANSPLAVQGTKAVLRAGDGRTVDEGLDYVALWNAAFLHSNDLGEAMASFIERRDPDFKGE